MQYDITRTAYFYFYPEQSEYPGDAVARHWLELAAPDWKSLTTGMVERGELTPRPVKTGWPVLVAVGVALLAWPTLKRIL